MKRSLRLLPVTSLAPLIGNGELVAFNVGPDGVVYLVVALERREYTLVALGRPQNYRVIGLREAEVVLDLVIEEEPLNVHHVQPVGHELLLACARSWYRGRDDFDRNGRIYSLDGKLAREILLGDGIQSIQTNARGEIWTSFFDEGVFGNFGWSNPIGASGLVAWDAEGRKLYEFEPTAGLDTICDCYALNVASDNSVWCCYYTEFPLVHIRSRKVSASWSPSIAGSSAFAILADHVLFRGGYEHRDTYHLFQLKAAGEVNSLGEVQVVGTDGTPLVASRVVGRGDALYLVCGDLFYRLDVLTALNAERVLHQ